MIALQMQKAVAPGVIGGGASFGPLDEWELVETRGGGALLVALVIIGAAAAGIIIGVAAYVFTH